MYDVTLFFPFIHQRQVTVFCLTFQWYDVMSKKFKRERLVQRRAIFFITTMWWYNILYQTTGTCFIKKIYAPPLPYFKVNICPLPLPHFASIFFAYLWSFRWPNYIVTLPRYFPFRLPHLNINTGHPSDELDKNIQRKSHFLFFSQWNGYSHFRSVLN